MLVVPLATRPAGAAIASAGQSGSHAPARTDDGRCRSRSGETLTYDVSWSSFLSPARAVATVQEKKAGRAIRRPTTSSPKDGRSARRAALSALLQDGHAGRQRTRCCRNAGPLYSEEGSRNAATEHDAVRPRRGTARHFESKTRRTTTATEYAVPPNAQDGLAALYVLRAGRSRRASDSSIPVADSGIALHRRSSRSAGPKRSRCRSARCQPGTSAGARPTRQGSRSGRTRSSGCRTTPGGCR